MYDAPLTVPAILLALVLLVSGIAKLLSLDTAAQAFTSLRLPTFLVRWRMPTLLPIGEIVLALALIVAGGWFAIVVDVAALLLFIGYLVVIVRALGFKEPVTCSCFGKLGLGSVDRFTAVRNLLLVVLAVITLIDGVQHQSVLTRLRHFDGSRWTWMAGVLGAVVLTWLISGHRGDDATAPSTSPAVDADGDYLRVPIPFVEVQTPQATTTTLRDLASTQAVLLLIVSPTCGSCTDVIAYARTWQRRVPSLRTCLVLPMQPTQQVPMLDDPEDFDILFDSTYAVARTFGVGNPSAVLLGADEKLAGGPVSGTTNVVAFMDDIVEELREADLPDDSLMRLDAVEAPADAMRPDDGEREQGAVLLPIAERLDVPQPDVDASDDGLLDYLPVPTPFVMFDDAAGATTSLRQIGARGPAILMFVSPGCGSCIRVMDEASNWQERLGDIPVHHVVSTEPQAQLIVERGVPENLVLIDEHLALAQMMGIGTPSMFAVGPAQELLAGPVSGYDEIASTMEQIIAEVAQVRPDRQADDATHEEGAVAAD